MNKENEGLTRELGKKTYFFVAKFLLLSPESSERSGMIRRDSVTKGRRVVKIRGGQYIGELLGQRAK
jgi:hypothetical protein